MRIYLQLHLQAICWPLYCSYSLCYLQLNNETLFLYYIIDVYSLTIKLYLNKIHQGRNPRPFVDHVFNILEIKRKSGSEDGTGERAPKRSRCDVRDTLRQSLSSETLDSTISMSQMLEIPVIDLVFQENQYSPLKPSASGLTLTPDKDNFYKIEDALRAQEPEMLDRLDFRESFSDNNGDNSGSLFSGENALFFLFLRSRSPSFSGFEDVNNNSESDYARCCKHGSLASDITLLQSNNFFAEKNSDVLNTIESGTIQSEVFLVTITKSRITLRLRLSKEIASQPKILLRLTQSKINKTQFSKSNVSRKRRRKT